MGCDEYYLGFRSVLWTCAQGVWNVSQSGFPPQSATHSLFTVSSVCGWGREKREKKSPHGETHSLFSRFLEMRKYCDVDLFKKVVVQKKEGGKQVCHQQ